MHAKQEPAPFSLNLFQGRPTFVSHLECSARGGMYPADELHGLSRAGKPLEIDTFND